MIDRLLEHRAALERAFLFSPDAVFQQFVEAQVRQRVQDRILEAKSEIYPILAEADALRNEYAGRVSQAQSAYEALSVRQAVLRALV
jgi:hypothetical protein